MIELVFVVCMIARPGSCEEKTLSFLAEGQGPMACLVEAPPTLATWTGEHPGFRIASWRCEDTAGRAERV